MRSRIQSSVFVVLIGLIPALAGGPVFALLMILLGVLGFREFVALGSLAGVPFGTPAMVLGSISIIGLGGFALVPSNVEAFFATLLFAVFAPLLAQLPQTATPGAITAWSMTMAGALYIGLPVFASVALRSHPGLVDSPSLNELAGISASLWPSAPLGLAWTLLVILATWIGDSAAYLTGRRYGQRKLAPVISPGKTVEGAIGGLIGSAMVGSMAFAAMGLGHWVTGFLVGALIGVAGQLGDLSESFLKRQAAAKDSGSIIPGHGGILDRIDALLFAFPTALLLAFGLERLQSL